MDELPESWVAVALSEAATNISIIDNKIPQKNYLPEGAYPIFDQGQEYIGGYTDQKEKVVECDLPVIIFGDHTRIVKFVNRPFASGADGVKVLQPKQFFDPKLFEYFTRHIATHLTNKGYARHYQHLAKSVIHLPPLPEQRRIVAKIEELFSELDKGIESLKTVREQIKVYRQSLLKHAFEGKLTEEWREENKDKLETAEALLKRIQTEREKRHQQQLADWEASGKQGGKPKAPKALPPLTADELAKLPELPDSWEWVKVGAIGDVQLGRQRSPSNRSNNFPTKYIRAGNLTDNGLNLENVLDMDFEPEERKRFLLNVGDVLLSEASGSASQVGKPAIWRGEIEQCCFQNTVIRVQSLPELSEYLFWVFRTFYISGVFSKLSGGVGINHLSAGKLANLAIPVAPVFEYQKLLEMINEKFSLIENLEQAIDQALQQAEAMRQSILKKAFSGQLVPQDPDDEPASVLLERIRAEKAAQPQRKKARA